MINPKEIIELAIYKQGVKAGNLVRTERGCDFVFDDNYFANSKYGDLSFNFLKNQKKYSVAGINLHSFFAGLLPEGLRLKAIINTIKTSEDDLFSIFAASGNNCIGDVVSLRDDNTKDLSNKDDLNKIDFYELFNKTITDNNLIFKSEGLPGIQTKISGSMINFPFKIQKTKKEFILKLNTADKTNLVENEYWILMLAKKCKISINNAKIIFDRNKNKGLLVERFDRIYDSVNNKMMQIHQEDACQFLDKYPAEKYRLSVNQICDGINNYSSAPIIDILTLLKLYVFCYIIGNGDLHAKNISLIIKDNKQVVLSPVYDLITTIIYGDQTMALKIDGKDNNITKKLIIDFGQRYGINKTFLEKMLLNLSKDIKKNFELLFNIPMNEKEKNFLERTVETRLEKIALY